jgi:uncharacterized protein (DUF952 family)
VSHTWRWNRLRSASGTVLGVVVCAHRLFHAALRPDWEAALRVGRYEVSTRGVTLADEGFIHASYQNQVERVVNTFYADVDELVLLEIDRDGLDVPVVDESASGDPADEHFPHIYGALPIDAVMTAHSWRRNGTSWRLDNIDRLP